MPTGTMIFDDVYLLINSVDLSDHVKAVAIAKGNKSVDDTRMGHTNEVKKPGLDNWKLTVTFAQDFANSSVAQTLKPLFGRGSNGFPVIFRPKNAARSGTNPESQMVGILTDYTPIGAGAPGDYAMAPITIENAGAMSELTTAT